METETQIFKPTTSSWDTLFLSYQNYQQRRQNLIVQGINDYCLLGTVLKVHDETRLHSRFIASLLNSRGQHYKQGFFTELLLTLLPSELQKFEPNKVEVQLEVATGKLDNHLKKGFIDILASDGQQYWIIENKLNAKDQGKQMARYIDWARDELDSDISASQLTFIYLSNNKTRPSKSSRGDYDIVEKDGFGWVHDGQSKEPVCRYLNLHYHHHICDWLELILEALDKQDQMRPFITDYQTALNRYLKKDKSKVNTLIDFINCDNSIDRAEHLSMLKDIELSLPTVKAQWLTAFMQQCENYVVQQGLLDSEYENTKQTFKPDSHYSESDAVIWFKHASPNSSDKGKEKGIFLPLAEEVSRKNGIDGTVYLSILYGKRKLHVGLHIESDDSVTITLDKRKRWKSIPNHTLYSKCVDLAEDIWLMGNDNKLPQSMVNLKTLCQRLKEGRV
ncbi:hypothetical protein BIT28_14140 [Photobacterium proteolyticum]|uniref:Uncharacterized protein n=1 Tax=Photobacterium proteolyticum TaxID=1903952 RepID=A0A1Q9H7E2_9GAMM|nr:PD-(D/E)XK nuclease family protein [Photobacterium proteolyticum]OLQ83771.1 hypothetical protein BIT28_14140 [Photobacterium proteolyticum]